MTFLDLTHAGRAACLQRRTVAEFAAVVPAHPALPVAAWTIASAGATPTGQVNGVVPGDGDGYGRLVGSDDDDSDIGQVNR